MLRPTGVPEFARRLAQVARDLVIFAGAGVSRDTPTCAPLFTELRSLLLHAIIEVLPPDEAKTAKAVLQSLADNERWANLKPEVFFQCARDFVHDELILALEILRLGRPNENHFRLCELAANGGGVIVTTNFEDYFERAQLKARVLYNSDPLLEELALEGWLRPSRDARELLVWHVHGSLMRPETLQITLEEVARSVRSPALERGLRALIAGLPMLVVGYSGRDDDVFPLLNEVGASGAGRELFWLAYSEEEVSEGPVSRLIATWGSRAHLAVGRLVDVFSEQPGLALATSLSVNAGDPLPELQARRSQQLSEWGRRLVAEECWRLLARFCWSVRDHRLAETCLRQASDGYSRTQNKCGVAHTASELGSVLLEMGNYDAAEAQLTRALETYREFGDEEASALSYHELARVAYMRGDLDKALEYAEKVRSIRGRRGNYNQIASSVHALGSLYLERGDFDLAEAHFEYAIQLRRSSGDLLGLGDAHHELGRVYQTQHRFEEAATHYKNALAIMRDLTLPRGYAATLFKLGEVALHWREDYAAARANFTECLAIYQAENNPVGIADCLNNLGIVCIAQRRWAEATNLLNRARTIFEDSGLETSLIVVYFNLGHVAFAQEDLESALAAAGKSVELVRRRPETVWTARATGLMGLVHSRRGNYAEAEPLLRKSSELFEKFRQTSDSWGQAVKRALDQRR